jgi:FAD/FMN-containing dehydrogenase/SAM-dependent methyltransferase
MSTRSELVVNDVTQLNPIPVSEIVVPKSIEEVAATLRSRPGPISVGGGRFSMGGQTASVGGVQLDMRGLNQILELSTETRRLTVQAGARWRDIQERIDTAGLSVKIMQTYSNFTVGGSLSVNVHGRYVGLGPLILSVAGIKVVLADGSVVEAGPQQRPELFYGCIGGYGALAVIVEATLELAHNARVARERVVMPLADYPRWFADHVRASSKAVFHNADIYLPACDIVSAVTWSETEEPVTVPERLHPRNDGYRLERGIVNLLFSTYFGKQYRRYVVDPLVYRGPKVEWRNYEASYDVAELEPPSRERSTHVLQEYFVPIGRLLEFVPRMAEILARFRVNALNVSIRHARPDPGSLLAWAREEVFSLVLYYRQRTGHHDRGRVAVWTRELIDAVLAAGGSYYLPYQPHATPRQFCAAYPRAPELFALKKRLDPGNKLRNTLWDRYYDPATGALSADETPLQARAESNFKAVFQATGLRDGFYRFLQNIYRLYPESRFHRLIVEACERGGGDREIYAELQRRLPEIAPFLGGLRYGLPALRKQQEELTRETAELLDGTGPLNGYVEVGTVGRYVDTLSARLRIGGPVYVANDVAPGYSPADLMERRGLRMPWRFVPLQDYAPVGADAVPDAVADLVTVFIGLHHSPLDRLDAFVASLRRMLKPGGRFVLRDHDVDSPAMDALVGLAHDVFNAGLGVPWETNAKELRLFRPLQGWKTYLAGQGFELCGGPIFQAHDPTRNALLLFKRV